MNLRRASGFLLTLVAGFAGGRMMMKKRSLWSHDQESSANSGKSMPSSPQSDDSSAAGEPSGPGRGKSRRGPGDSAAHPAGEARVSVPMSEIVQALKQSPLNYWYFMGDHSAIDDALTMLGVSGKSRDDVLALVDHAKQELRQEEATQVKVDKANGSVVTLDFSGMKEPSEKIATQTQAALSGLLPPDIAEALSGSVDWDHTYFRGDNMKQSAWITRDGDGGLVANYTGFGFIPLANFGDYRDDGTPVPAALLVPGEQWPPLLEGVTLLPTDGDPR